MKILIRCLAGLGLLVLLFLAIGCGGSEEQKNKAQQAMDAAAQARAQSLAPVDWTSAMQAWDEALAAENKGKSSSSMYLKAKSRFDKAAAIAKAKYADLEKEVTELVKTIPDSHERLQAAIEKSKLPAKIKDQAKTLSGEVDQERTNLKNLMEEGDYVRAKIKVKIIQRKIYDAELLLQGQKK
jgi:hypothetical protein